ncbi:MAG: glycosyltransferase family 2 protein [Paludibacteraceae bacterium]|nr:glycosyltransferase family 2 protein [Paludibacteraceae bacterium]
MISVVIPLYNKAQSIVHTLDSVLAQTYNDYEVIIVNDGSIDHSQQVVEQWLVSSLALRAHHSIDSSFRLINKPNGGVSSARNAGILAAKGEYVAFLDGDDLWDSTYLEELAALIKEYPEAGIYGIGNCMVKDGASLPKMDNTKAQHRMVNNPWKENLYFWTGSSSSSSRANLIKVGLFDERMEYGEDLDMWYRLLLLGGGAISTKVLAYYVQDAENRAMHKVISLEKHIPYYIDKYAEARALNADFRRYFDQEMVGRLYPYMFDKHYRKQAKALSKKIDYSQLKFTMWLRMVWPEIYRIYEKIKQRKASE